PGDHRSPGPVPSRRKVPRAGPQASLRTALREDRCNQPDPRSPRCASAAVWAAWRSRRGPTGLAALTGPAYEAPSAMPYAHPPTDRYWSANPSSRDTYRPAAEHLAG